MLTPAYALTATERVLPRLALDFTTASLDARVTVTRALDTATRVNSSGLIETVNANLPRFDYNPSTKVCKGLLIEETRVQTARGSDLMSAWSRSSTTASANVVVSPDGTQNADLIYPSSSGNNRQVYIQSSTAPTSGNVAISVFAADAGLNWLVIYSLNSTTPVAWFDVANGVKGTVVAGWTSEIEPYENGFYRCSVVGTAVAGGYITFGVADADNSVAATASSTNGLYFWGAQCEAGAFKTSYIRNPDITNGSSVTRNVDDVGMTGTNFSDWYNATEGTVVASFQVPVATGAARRAISINDGTANDSIQIALVNSNNQGYVEIRDNLSVQVTSTVGPNFTVGTPVNISLAYKVNSFAYAAFGGAAGTDPTGTVPTVSQMQIGAHIGTYMNGWVSKINYYPQRLTDAEVRAISK